MTFPRAIFMHTSLPWAAYARLEITLWQGVRFRWEKSTRMRSAS